MKILGVLALLASVAGAQSLAAQALPDTVLQVGTRVRVQSPVLGVKPRPGNFVSLAGDTLSFTLEGETVPTRIPVAQVTAVDVSRGSVRNRAAVEKRSVIPEIIGAAVGAAVGIAAGSGSSRMKLLLGAAGGLGGYIAGRTYGSVTTASTVEKWQPVTLRAARR
jgi:hypothetical protein